jgi:branched-chain amino acid transport system ATP-binding protein
MLKVENLHVSYGKIRAVRDVSIEVNRGEVVALIGPNGAGKSTLLKTIAGILKCESGSVQLQGAPIQNVAAAEVARKGVAMVLEGRSTLKNMTVLENLILGGYMRSDHAEIAHDIQRMLERFPALKARQSQRAGTLSGGEQQMLVIARALISRPSLLMLDEPSLGLAPLMTAEIFAIIRELKTKHETTILLVEQNARQALQLADRGYVLETGRIVLEGAGLADNPAVREAYLGV